MSLQQTKTAEWLHAMLGLDEFVFVAVEIVRLSQILVLDLKAAIMISVAR